MDINGAVVLVTGASSVIGAATARAASHAGARVVLAAPREERIRQLADELGEAVPGSGAYASSKEGLAKLSAVARAELASADITVSTMYPFVTATEFTNSVRAGRESAARLESSHAPQPQAPDPVAAAILDLIRTGAEQADLVPERFGGTFKG
jgi:NADP-dependent 3-hydroxy acid dehydrogenase YdfG